MRTVINNTNIYIYKILYDVKNTQRFLLFPFSININPRTNCLREILRLPTYSPPLIFRLRSDVTICNDHPDSKSRV